MWDQAAWGSNTLRKNAQSVCGQHLAGFGVHASTSPHASRNSPAVRPQGLPAGCSEPPAADVGAAPAVAVLNEAEEASKTTCWAATDLEAVLACRGTTSSDPASTVDDAGSGGGSGGGLSRAPLLPASTCSRSGAFSAGSLPGISLLVRSRAEKKSAERAPAKTLACCGCETVCVASM